MLKKHHAWAVVNSNSPSHRVVVCMWLWQAEGEIVPVSTTSWCFIVSFCCYDKAHINPNLLSLNRDENWSYNRKHLDQSAHHYHAITFLIYCKQQEHEVTLNHNFCQSLLCQVLSTVKTQAEPRCTKFLSIHFFFFTAPVLAALSKHWCTFIIVCQKQHACNVMCAAHCQRWMNNTAEICERSRFISNFSVGCGCTVWYEHMDVPLTQDLHVIFVQL